MKKYKISLNWRLKLPIYANHLPFLSYSSEKKTSEVKKYDVIISSTNFTT